MPRYKLILEYDGTPFVGWQLQDNGLSVQGRLAQAIKAFSGEDTVPRGAGRTDAGVHASGQVAHFDLAKDWAANKVRDALNAQVRPDPISVLVCEQVGGDFDARYSATARHYVYRIVNRRSPLALDRNRAWQVVHALDEAAMHEAAQALVGNHDFTTFRSAECQAASPVKTLDRLDVTRAGEAIAIAGVGPLLPAQSGALHGRLAQAGRRGQVADCRPRPGARCARSRRLRPGGARFRPLPCQGRLLRNAASFLRLAGVSG